MKVLWIGISHYKIRKNTLLGFKKLGIELTKKVSECDIIYSPTLYIDPMKYPTKKVILGPQLGVIPSDIKKSIDNIYDNAYYIQPCQWAKDFWLRMGFKSLPIHVCPVGIDTEEFKPTKPRNERNKVIIYWKDRAENEIRFLEEFAQAHKLNYKIIAKPYEEYDYMVLLHESQYGIWLGSHESQGIALQEALACDVPLLVWDVTRFSQSTNIIPELKRHDDFRVTTVPYWDETCGELFYNREEIEKVYELFMSKLETYKPREFIIKNLDIVDCAKRLIDGGEYVASTKQ